MTDILDFNRKPQPKEYKESHLMSCAREDDYLVWRCHECSRKVKTSLITDEMVFERQGNFFAHHTFQSYRPSLKECEEADLPPVDLDAGFDFPQILNTTGYNCQSHLVGASKKPKNKK